MTELAWGMVPHTFMSSAVESLKEADASRGVVLIHVKQQGHVVRLADDVLATFQKWQRGHDVSTQIQEVDGELYWLAVHNTRVKKMGRFALAIPSPTEAACPRQSENEYRWRHSSEEAEAPNQHTAAPRTRLGSTVLVVVPGAGYRCNRVAYDALSPHYVVHAIGTSTLGSSATASYDRYPDDPEWRHIDSFPPPNLKTLARDLVLPAIQDLKPCCIIFGSRGGQVTAPTLWKHGIRIPMVIVNGGCVTSVREPGKVPPPNPRHVVLFTGGRDYFATRSPNFTRSCVNSKGMLLVHDELMAHMPSTQMLTEALPLFIQAAVDGSGLPLLHLPGMGAHVTVERL
eukprot:gnl/TRDRNA2_/TRDRNA2_31551_c1_seq1.p1 gnl/TRDRNA2_/TRDRNA2_31551_c1~~gnl/TRDRNA2_/TRDRNA2_31551_c1_seq1.p1  ORF type:complete len:391 (+),score=35.18 gnl/TRDRNA2_/TRDRNA2_31551_c1_seq1:146-1174(+)